MEKSISCKSLYKSYKSGSGKLEILKGVDLDIYKAKSVSITGKSGCGKTTLLHCLGTLENYDSGKIMLLDQDISKLKKKDLQELRKKHISFIFQEHYLLDELNVINNVLLSDYINKTNNKEYAYYLLELLGLKDRAKHYPKTISGGERQRVSIARALLKRPSIVFADEPTGELDESSSLVTEDLLLKVVDKSKTSLVLVTHNTDFANKCDIKYTLCNGVIIKDEINS